MGGGLVQQHSKRTSESEMAALQAEHRALKARLRELGRHVALTSAERLEVARLKKLKLRAKDRIELLGAGTT